jgi:hypothetical protein
MELELIRTYYPTGTNGKIQYQGRLMMYSIELPWKENHAQVSCIPEGRYELVKRWSPKFNRHLRVYCAFLLSGLNFGNFRLEPNVYKPCLNNITNFICFQFKLPVAVPIIIFEISVPLSFMVIFTVVFIFF